jgi:hypothetical protein
MPILLGLGLLAEWSDRRRTSAADERRTDHAAAHELEFLKLRRASTHGSRSVPGGRVIIVGVPVSARQVSKSVSHAKRLPRARRLDFRQIDHGVIESDSPGQCPNIGSSAGKIHQSPRWAYQEKFRRESQTCTTAVILSTPRRPARVHVRGFLNQLVSRFLTA